MATMTPPRECAPTRALPGDLAHDGRVMKYAHGQHAAYVLDRCRCEPCRDANRVYENARAQRVEPAYVDATEARAHVEYLRTHNVGLKTIAKASGVPHGSIAKLMYGDGARGMGPSKRVRRATADRILAVTPADAAGGSQQPAGPTWALIDAMTAAGVTRAAIARYIGQTGPGLQLSTTTINRRHVVKVKEMHDQWLAGDLTLTARGHRNVPTPAVIAPPRPQRADVIVLGQTRAREYTDLIEELAVAVEIRTGRDWRSSAACRGANPSTWFPSTGDTIMSRAAKRVCRACTVQRTCLIESLAEPFGVFGGLEARTRKTLAKALAGRSTDDIVIRPLKGVYVLEHGTMAGYRDHLHNRTEPCDACRVANTVDTRVRRSEGAA